MLLPHRSDPKDNAKASPASARTRRYLRDQRWIPRGYYVDNDRSASNGKARPEWERLLADIEAGRIDAIAAWDQDRGGP